MKRALITASVIALILSVFPAETQSTRKQAPKSPGARSERQGQLREIRARQDMLRKQATQAFDREMGREKAGDCPDARTTYEANICLGKDIETARANYGTYVDALRSLLALESPGESDASGPTGKPLTADEKVKEFDESEALWQKYLAAHGSFAFDIWKGGTIAPSMSARCELQALRDRMRELDGIFDSMLRH